MTGRLRERLDPGQVHVYTAAPEQPEDPGLLRAYAALLSEPERERLARLRSAPARRRFLVSRALLRTVLSRYAAVEPHAWAFTTTQYGRPEIRHPELAARLRFNLSHTDGLVACAVAWEREVGVDVEAADRPARVLGLARRFFAPAEIADLESREGPALRARFFEYWTLKEAYLKGRGLGLRIPLSEVGFLLADAGAAAPRIVPRFGAGLGDDAGGWQFELRRPSRRHHLALAVRRRDEPDLDLCLHDGAPMVP